MFSYANLDKRLKKLKKNARPAKVRGPNGSKAPSKSASRRVRAFNAPVSYRVPGIVPPLRQPTSDTCWATVSTMMICWRRNQSMSIEEALGTVGPDWVRMFKANEGLLAKDKGAFAAAAGFQFEPPMSYSIEGWLQMLRTYGPLWVTTDEDPRGGFSIHARIMVGMHGDGTPDGTNVSIVDPATATEYPETVTTFVRKFEEEARDTGPKVPLRIQVVHWAPNAQSTTQSRNASSFTVHPPTYRPSRSFTSTTLAWGKRVSPDFQTKIKGIASGLGCDANHIMAVMAFESGETFSPSIKNKLSGATGLIQFMPKTAQSLGTSVDALAAMSAEEQLDYVEKYLRPYNGKLNTIEDCYMAVLWPRAVGKSAGTVLFSAPSKAYEQNIALDADKDGSVTKEEAASPARKKLTKGLAPANAT